MRWEDHGVPAALGTSTGGCAGYGARVKAVIRNMDREAWNDERVELLKKLWSEEFSASQIAGRLGGVTRNAVIGKIHRLGLSHTVTHRPPKFRKKEAKPRRQRPKLCRSLNVGGFIGTSTPLPPEPVRPEKLFTLTEITDREDNDHVKLCRFIYGDPRDHDSGYCGCEAAPGSSYCPGHHHMVFTAPSATFKKVNWNWNDNRGQVRIPGRRQQGVHCS